MCVLSNLQIVDSLKSGNLVIEPEPSINPDVDGSPYDTCSVQLHIDNEIWVPKKDLRLSFDLSYPGELSNTLDSVCTKNSIPATGYVLEPGSFILAKTKEKVGFPLHSAQKPLAGRIEGRSSFARTGLLVHFTAPTLHAGWTGHITLELLNHGPLSLTLRPGLAICQLIVETVKGYVIPNTGQQFNNQATPSGRQLEPQTE